jgi:HD-GYP domain-containing protein (c-di-GMP phosphodiesterase class II)
MNKILVSSLNTNMYFNAPVLLDEKFILLSQDTPVNAPLIKRLKQWGYSYVYTDGLPGEKPVHEITAAASSASTLTFDQDIKEQESLKDVGRFFNGMLDFTEKIFTDFVTKNELSIKLISEKAKELIDKVKERRHFILRLSGMKSVEKNYIVVHSVKTAILCTAVGIQLRLPPHKLIELGMAALLHEIGMIRLPPQLYMSNKVLTPQEKRAITAHTVLGFKILKSYSFPMSVCLSVLEHHEHMDGTGYPRGLTGERISVPAKILGVCGAYAALISKRPYRSGKEGHAVVLDLLKERGKHYDETILKALVYCISIFPLGSYVILADGTKGMVVEPNIENPRAPIVKILIAQGGERLKDPILVKSEEKDRKIIRPLTQDEIRAINPGAVQDSD